MSSGLTVSVSVWHSVSVSVGAHIHMCLWAQALRAASTTLLSLNSLWSHPELGHFSQLGHFFGIIPQMPKGGHGPLLHHVTSHPEFGRDYPPLLHQTLALNLTLSQSKV